MTSIYANLWEQKNVFTEEKGGQLPQDWFGTPIWLSIYGLNTYMVAVTSYENALYPVPGEIALKSYPLFTTQQSYIGPCMNYVIGQNEICQAINPGCSPISFVSFSLILGPGDKGNWGLIISNQGHLPSVTQLCLGGGRGGGGLLESLRYFWWLWFLPPFYSPRHLESRVPPTFVRLFRITNFYHRWS